MKKIISFVLSLFILVNALDVPASAYLYFGYGYDGSTITVNDSFYDLLDKIGAGSTELDLTSKVSLEKQGFSNLMGSHTSVKFARYKFKLNKKDTIKFDIEASKDYLTDCTAIFIFNDEDEIFYQEGFKRTSRVQSRAYSDSVTLPKGTYYFFLATEKYTTGDFNLTVEAPKHKEAKPNFKLTAQSGGKIKVSWKKISNASKYRVYKYVNGKFKLIKTTKNTSYTVKNLVGGNKYSYVVTACVNGKWTTPSLNDVKSKNAKK